MTIVLYRVKLRILENKQCLAWWVWLLCAYEGEWHWEQGRETIFKLANSRWWSQLEVLHRIFWIHLWQVSQTNTRRPLISKRRISLLQLGHCFFAKIFTRSLYRVLDGCASSTVIIAFCLTPIVRSALASSQTWLNVWRLISLPGVSGWTDCLHRISDR